ncbi:hypothetical protein [Nocardia sp. MW-W600-9]
MTLPVVPVEQRWGGRPTRGVLVFTAFMAVALLAVAVGWVVMGVLAWRDSSPVTRLGYIGAAMLFVGAAGMFGTRLLTMFPRIADRIVPAATVHTDAEWGAGIRLRHESDLLTVELLLAGCGVFGFTAWWGWRTGTGALLPFASDNSGGAITALVFSIICVSALVLMLLVRVVRIRWELYPAGIVSRNPLRDEVRLGWDEIVAVRGDVCRLSAQRSAAPVVMAELVDATRPPQHGVFDRVGELGIPACLLQCDSDVLLAVIIRLHEDPDTRPLLTTDAAPRWFTTRYHQPRD